MWKVVALLLLSLICLSYAVDSEVCKQPPSEKNCIISYTVKDQWPHKIRYVYNWSIKTCVMIRWANYCPAVRSPPTTNNFASAAECMKECGG